MTFALIASVWIGLGIVAYGLQFHHYQERFKCFAYQSLAMHRMAALVGFIGGPIGLAIGVLMRVSDSRPTPWGLRYRQVPEADSWASFHERWPPLTREQWRKGVSGL